MLIQALQWSLNKLFDTSPIRTQVCLHMEWHVIQINKHYSGALKSKCHLQMMTYKTSTQWMWIKTSFDLVNGFSCCKPWVANKVLCYLWWMSWWHKIYTSFDPSSLHLHKEQQHGQDLWYVYNSTLPFSL